MIEIDTKIIAIIISALCLLTTLFASIITIAGVFFFTKFQTNQNKADNEKLTLDLEQTKRDNRESFSRLYSKIDESNDRVIDKIDQMKKDFVSLETCRGKHTGE